MKKNASITITLPCIIILSIVTATTCFTESCVERALLAHLGACHENGPECVDTCGDHMPVNATTKAECDEYSDCCFKDGECIQLSTSDTPAKEEPIKSEEDVSDPVVDGDNEDPNDSGKRDFGPKRDAFDDQYVSRFGDSNPVTCNTDRFPYNCRQESYSSNNLACVVNIPYCLRVPCMAAHSQDEVENNAIACGSYPGCCYDEELSTYRRHFGQRILPGVPVCHYAVRNHVFQKHAQQYSDSFGGWNPMLTTCLIEALKEKIFGDTAGCYMATAVEFFGLKAKQAGWKGIGPLECYLIDGCYRPGRGCVYPFDARKGITLNPNEQFHDVKTVHDGVTTAGHDLHNKYPCQQFTNLNDPYAYLTTYHQCLSSGCSVDKSVQSLYLQHLWNISRALGPQGREQYWKGVMSYEIRADNFLDELEKYKEFYTEPDYDTPIVPLNIQPNRFPSVVSPFMPHPLGHSRMIYPAHMPHNARCAFRIPEVPNFPILRGSFEGCCDKPLCYFSSQKIRREQLYSELTYYFSSWSAWSKCSKSCNGGRFRRIRTCISHNQVTPQNQCEGQEEIKPCNTEPCPHWGQWGEYGACSVTCGGGLRARQRRCIGQKKCAGSKVQHGPCGQRKCESATPWSAWTSCSTTCGRGFQTRSRRCLEGCPSDFKPFENRECNVYCGRIVWTSWSLCEEKSCTMKREASCMHGDARGYCKTIPDSISTPCRENSCYCKKYPAQCKRQIPQRHHQPSNQYAPSRHQVYSQQRQYHPVYQG